jgi:hypothetical protein
MQPLRDRGWVKAAELSSAPTVSARETMDRKRRHRQGFGIPNHGRGDGCETDANKQVEPDVWRRGLIVLSGSEDASGSN